LTYTPGYIASISINGTQVEADAENCVLTQLTNVIPKNTLGVPDEQYIPGLKGGTFSTTLHMNTTEMAALVAANASTVAVPFVVRAGSLGTYDNGSDAFNGSITSFEKSGSFDDNWSVDLSVQISGAVTYTPPI
jgi:hypothetical protein